jgi:hypothetical protein
MRAELCPSRGWAFNGRVLIERDQEVDRLLELLGDAVDGESRLVFLGGEAGVGMTRHPIVGAPHIQGAPREKVERQLGDHSRYCRPTRWSADDPGS